ncbi:U11/U12 small nuclear ribonucleoprotein 35 kDa protein-like isoform X1 [Limulus polyphemus]|uniref:U11/U12 small nuclear ribonucleoprotein 35 kDa protein-like isoform X1 n=2 Tax=Limulus polyphemus TaxID=6850 RepID=A0ABM1BKV2_LIMPO|nr:U11/U12 small nuclear ribonucleoprotein 35 kDa protein-like isoform X1 [Limulus polyphemus]XP_022252168.1 U11/U12 small nuclear ribonucleoprotein 35 kDa protein-like isoform X1 [Limulus polyphemus]
MKFINCSKKMFGQNQWSPYAKEYIPLQAGSIDGTDTVPHDHGIVRAMQASYSPNDLVIGDPKCTLFVSRLNINTTEETLKKFFEKYGEIRRCRLVKDIVTGFSRRYGFVEYKDRHVALHAQRETYRTVLEDSEIFVDFECERTLIGWVPRRLGGGFGGKKESGQLRFGGRDRPFKKPIIVKPKLEDSRNNFHRRKDDDRSQRYEEKNYRRRDPERQGSRHQDRWHEGKYRERSHHDRHSDTSRRHRDR